VTIRLADRAVELGVDFTARNGEEANRYAIVESLGTGVALRDFDGDGLLDVWCPGGGRFDAEGQPVGLDCGLFRRVGSRFVRVTGTQAPPAPAYLSHAAGGGDLDGDGFCDLVRTGYGGAEGLVNCGDGTFVVRELVDPGPAGPDAAGPEVPGWVTSVAWGDLDDDGDLDLYLARYVDWSKANDPECRQNGRRDVCPPGRFGPLDDLLLVSQGTGLFERAGPEWGLVSGGKGLGVVAGDVNLDAAPDLYIANDTTENFLYLNEQPVAPGAHRLREVGLVSGTAYGERSDAEGSMGVDLGDVDGDGRLDLWVSNFEDQFFALYRGVGPGLFQYASGPAGVMAVGRAHVGFGTVLGDLDLDGDLDAFATNGHVLRQPANSPLAQPPLLFLNDGRGQFLDVAGQTGDYGATGHRGRGVALGDLDADGDLDLAVTHLNEPVALLLNETPRPAAWLHVTLVGTTASREPVGGRLEIEQTGRTLVLPVKGGGSYLSTNEPALVCGLVGSEAHVAGRVIWPGGKTQSVRLPVSERVLLIEGREEPVRLPPAMSPVAGAMTTGSFMQRPLKQEAAR
jgi:enediyne biosynthesis protein E4